MNSVTLEVRRANWFVVLITQIRSFVAILFCIAFTIFMSAFVITAGFLGSSTWATRFMRFWSGVVLGVFNIRLRASGQENLPQAGGGIIVFNHQSHLDIPSMMLATSRCIRFGAKIELFKIPFFGASMRAVGTLPIARDNRNEVLRIYRDAQKRFEQNTIFVLAPEGTRQTEPKLGRFKKGPFLFALNAQVPIIPVVLKGAYEIFPKNSLTVNVGKWSRTIRIEFLPPVSTKGLAADQAARLLKEVQSTMETAFERL